MKPKAIRALEVAQQIGVLRLEMQRLEREFESLVSDEADSASRAGAGLFATQPSSMPSRVLSFMSQAPEGEASVKELVGPLDSDVPSVSSTLSRLMKAGKVERVRKGVYRLVR